ncbi:MAG: SAF domain-containing protein, partial [Anaerolineae bacterium]
NPPVQPAVDDTTGDTVQAPPEPGVPIPTATPSLRLVNVVVATIDLPVGEEIRSDLVTIEQRPDTNIAIIGQYTYSTTQPLIGQIARVEINKGQAILTDMVTDIPNELGALGSDLALYLEPGQVAVPFPIDKYSGLAYAMRPGDNVDVLMTLRVVETDPEFNTALPNVTQRVIESELLAGRAFLFPKTTQGRLEFVQEVGQTVEMIPNKDNAIVGQDFAAGDPIPKRVTQLTIQQAKVLWVGTWFDPREGTETAVPAEPAALNGTGTTGETPGAATTDPELAAAPGGEQTAAAAGPVSSQRSEQPPDVIILSMTAQDALALKYAMDRGVDIDLALRAQGDFTPYTTVSVSLPQIIDLGGLVVPEPSDFDLHPRAEDVKPPTLPVEPLSEPPPGG